MSEWTLETLKELTEAQIEALEQQMHRRFKAADHAAEKSDEALSARLDSMNEFRAQLNSQAKTFVTRDLIDERDRAQRVAMDKALDLQSALLGRVEDEQEKRTRSLEERIVKLEQAASNVRTQLIMLGGFVTFIISVVVVVANFITTP